jgi:hypothetical protein
MIKFSFRICIFAFFSLIFFGCQEGITITVTDVGDKAPIFKLEPMSPFKHDGAEITKFWITESDKNGQIKNVIWRIESISGMPRLTNEIRFGVSPDGFREVGDRKPLTSGVTYEAGAGMADKIGFVTFTLQ